MKCEELRWKDRQPCKHEAKYLAPFDSKAVCGVHARGYTQCIPIAEIEPAAPVGSDQETAP